MANYNVPVVTKMSWQQPVKDKDLIAPPGSESKGDRYIIKATASGDWIGEATHIAMAKQDNPSQASHWLFITPSEGWQCWVEDEDKYYKFDGSNWIVLSVEFGRPLILTPQNSCGPAASFATQDTIPGGSTPNEVVSVLDFDDSASEYADFKFALPPGYDGGGLTVTVIFSMTSDHDEVTPHRVKWGVAFRRIQDDEEDINGSHAYDFNSINVIVPSVVGEVSYDDIIFTSGVDMDNVAAGEMAILRIFRHPEEAIDDAVGDAELHMIIIKETS